MSDSPDFYASLGLRLDVPYADIEIAYRELCTGSKSGGADKRFLSQYELSRILGAYRILGEETNRKEYDASLRRARSDLPPHPFHPYYASTECGDTRQLRSRVQEGSSAMDKIAEESLQNAQKYPGSAGPAALIQDVQRTLRVVDSMCKALGPNLLQMLEVHSRVSDRESEPAVWFELDRVMDCLYHADCWVQTLTYQTRHGPVGNLPWVLGKAQYLRDVVKQSCVTYSAGLAIQTRSKTLRRPDGSFTNEGRIKFEYLKAMKRFHEMPLPLCRTGDILGCPVCEKRSASVSRHRRSALYK